MSFDEFDQLANYIKENVLFDVTGVVGSNSAYAFAKAAILANPATSKAQGMKQSVVGKYADIHILFKRWLNLGEYE